MKKLFTLVLSVLMATALSFAAEVQHMTDEQLDYAEIVNSISKVRPPYLAGDKVIFTAESGPRHIGIAFDFEGFRTIHSFKLKKILNVDFEESRSLYFYVLDLPKDVLAFDYRVIVDGLWSVDSMNESTVYSREADILLSHFDASRYIPPVTEKKPSGKVQFVYRGKSGQQVRVGGSFTNWDSWIYQMTEVSPGLYKFELSLPPGKYEYAFYTGITSFHDASNPQKCYTNDGKIASLLVVN